jgi:hypothetical protein
MTGTCERNGRASIGVGPLHGFVLGLRQFEFKPFRGKVAVNQYGCNEIDDIRTRELHGRNIHANAHVDPEVGPRACLSVGMTECEERTEPSEFVHHL